MILALCCQHFQHSYHQDQDAQHLLYLQVPAFLEPWWLWETTAENHLVGGLTIFADHTMHQKHILNAPHETPTADIPAAKHILLIPTDLEDRRGIRVPAVAEVVVDTLLTETTLSGVRGADHRDGHTTTIQTTLLERTPRTTWRRPSWTSRRMARR